MFVPGTKQDAGSGGWWTAHRAGLPADDAMPDEQLAGGSYRRSSVIGTAKAENTSSQTGSQPRHRMPESCFTDLTVVAGMSLTEELH